MSTLDPSQEAVTLWLKQLNREGLHGQGWIQVNKRYNGITKAFRQFLNDQFQDKQEREAAFDGLTLALMAFAHFEDISNLSARFTDENTGPKEDDTLRIGPESPAGSKQDPAGGTKD